MNKIKCGSAGWIMTLEAYAKLLTIPRTENLYTYDVFTQSRFVMDKCLICDGLLHIFDDFRKLNNVTSDLKPINNVTDLAVCQACGHVQKIMTERFMSQVAEIYRNYEVFHLSKGVEQVIFVDGGAQSRSGLIASWLKQRVLLPDDAAVLDYGCGDCSALVSMSRVFSNAEFYGYEIEELPRPKLGDVHNFKEMLVGHDFRPNSPLNLITMIHCLEHVPNPFEVLSNVWDHLVDGGYLFIEVPDLMVSLYDVLIADHVSHYSQDILESLVHSCGFEIVDSTTDYLKKEITLLARKNGSGNSGLVVDTKRFHKQREHVESLLQQHVETVIKSREILKNQLQVAIFGTSISGMWLWGELNNSVKLFVDEDENKVGKNSSYEVFLPKDVPDGCVVIIPLIWEIAQKIIARYADHPSRFIMV